MLSVKVSDISLMAALGRGAKTKAKVHALPQRIPQDSIFHPKVLLGQQVRGQAVLVVVKETKDTLQFITRILWSSTQQSKLNTKHLSLSY